MWPGSLKLERHHGITLLWKKRPATILSPGSQMCALALAVMLDGSTALVSHREAYWTFLLPSAGVSITHSFGPTFGFMELCKCSRTRCNSLCKQTTLLHVPVASEASFSEDLSDL